MAGGDGNARYAAERARQLTRRGDPQTARPAPGGRRDAADPSLPCACTADDQPGHAGWWHHLIDAEHATRAELAAYAARLGVAGSGAMTRAQLAARFAGHGWRTWCSIATAAGRCGCEAYDPASNPVAKQEPPR